MRPKKYEFEYDFNDNAVKYQIWLKGQAHNITTVLLLGTLQTGRSAQTVAEYLEPGVAVVQGAPHWLAKDDGSDTPEFMYKFTEHSINSAKKLSDNKKITLIAESQAAPGLIKHAIKHKHEVNKVVLLQPLGLNPDSFASKASPIDEFNNRVRCNLKYQLKSVFTDKMIVKNHTRLLAYYIKNAKNGKSAQQYTTGLRYSSVSELRELSIATNVYLIIGENDQIFKPNEIIDTLRKHNISVKKIIVVPKVPHSPLSSRAGFTLLRHVPRNQLTPHT